MLDVLGLFRINPLELQSHYQSSSYFRNGAYGNLCWGLALLLALLLLCVSYFLFHVLPPFREGLKDRSFVLCNLSLVAVFFVQLGIAGGYQQLLL